MSREKILSRTENLKEAHVEVQLFNLTPAETEFKMDFWGQIVSNVDDDLGGQSADAEPMRLEVESHTLSSRRAPPLLHLTLGTAFLCLGMQDTACLLVCVCLPLLVAMM